MSTFENNEYVEIENALTKLSLKYNQLDEINNQNLLKFEHNSEQIFQDLEKVNKLEEAFITKYGFDELKEIDKLKDEYNLNEEYVVNEILNIQTINKSISKLLYNKNYKKVEPIFIKLILGLSFIKDNKDKLKNIDLENLTFQFKKSLTKLLMFVNKEILNNKFIIMSNRFKIDGNEEDLLVNENLINFISSDIAAFFKMTSVIETYFNESQFFNRDVVNMNNDLFNRYFKARYDYSYKKLDSFLKQLETEGSEDKQLLLTNFNNDFNSFILQEYSVYENLLNYEYKPTIESTILNEQNAQHLKKKNITISNTEILKKIYFNDRFAKYLQSILNDLQFLKKLNILLNDFGLDDVIMGIYSYNRYFEYEDEEVEEINGVSLSDHSSDLMKKFDYKSLVKPLLENFHIKLFKLIKTNLESINKVSKESLLTLFKILVKIYDILPLSIFTNFLNYILSTLLQKKLIDNSVNIEDDDEEEEEVDKEVTLKENIFFILVIQHFIKNFELDIDHLNNNMPFDNISLSTIATTTKTANSNTNVNSINVLSSIFTDLVSKLIKNEIHSIFRSRLEIHSNNDYLKLNEFILIDLKQVYSEHYKKLEDTLFTMNKEIDAGNDNSSEDTLYISLAVPDDDILEFLSNYKFKLNFQILSTYSQLSKINGEELVSLETLKEAIEE
ncbi:hypothetical protein ACO0SA_004078 [Hanseniaspora valbyensis]